MFFTECILEAKQTHCFIKKKKISLLKLLTSMQSSLHLYHHYRPLQLSVTLRL